MLLQGGIQLIDTLTPDATFDAILEETRTHLASGSFDRVLEVCLDKGTDMLFSGIEKNIFAHEAGEWDDPNTVGLSQEPKVRLAGMLPPLARWCRLALEGLPNELIDVCLASLYIQSFIREADTSGISGPGEHERGCSAVCYNIHQLR